MRVISGTARGRHLRAAPETRPTADLVKGAIFSILEALAYKRGFEPDEETGDFAAARAWPRVLDLFAGSGALGIEALSRGAQFADFVEQDRDAARILSSNVRAAGVDDRARVHQTTVALALRSLRGPVDVVFADPPYSDREALDAALAALSRDDLLLPTSVVVVEHTSGVQPPGSLGALAQASSRRHGRTNITLYAASSG
jgi:16S rRNA (guanine966-N2)-methyltransferase